MNIFIRVFDSIFSDIFGNSDDKKSPWRSNYLDFQIRDNLDIPITENDGTPITIPENYYD